MKRCIPILVPLLLAAGASGCATSSPYQAVPDVAERSAALKNIVMIPPQVEIYEVSAGGAQERMPEWSAKGRENITRAVCEVLSSRRGVNVRILDTTLLSSALKASLRESDAMFDAVNRAVVRHTYGNDPEVFKNKVAQFDYTIGGEVQEADSTADGFLIVRGVDYISSAGRVAAQAGAAIVGALFGVSIVPASSPTFVFLALVDARTGDVLWHSVEAKRGDYNLRDQASAEAALGLMMKSFPLGTYVKK